VSEDDDLDQPPPKQRGGFKRFLRRFAVVVGVLLAVWVVGRWQVARVGERKLRVAVGNIEAAEPGWKFDAIEAERRLHAPSAGQNSAPLVDEIAAAIPDEWDKWRQAAEWTALPQRKGESNHLPADKHVGELRDLAAATAAARDRAHALRDFPRGHRDFELPDNPIALLLPHLDRVREVADLLNTDALLASLGRDPDRAVRAAHATLNAARSVGDEPILISQLVRMACRARAVNITLQTLAWGTPKAGLAELQAEFLREADEPLFLYGIRGERAAMHKMFLGLEAGKIDLDGILPANERPTLGKAAFRAYRPLLFSDHAEFLRLITGYVEAAKLPWEQQRDAVKAVLPDGKPDGLDRAVTRLLLPACERFVDAGLKSRAKLLTAATAVACERFRQQHGRWPESLQEIPKSILAAVPVSPFDGKPLRYRVLPDGIVVSCFCRDDKFDVQGPPEYREPGVKGFAKGARLWNPELRGLPPPPPEKENDDQ
jgi:hypothetical protein